MTSAESRLSCCGTRGTQSVPNGPGRHLAAEGNGPAELQHWDFGHFPIQPMDGPAAEAALRASLAFVMANPGSKLSLQSHKLIGLPWI